MRNKMEDSDNVELENPPKTIKYVRRADRTPEKDFYLKGQEEKIQTCVTRSAVKRVREKLTRLEDAIDKRDKEIDQEKKLRQEMENKLHDVFSDMYNNPDVNQELRARLPRANKSDPFKQEEISETDLSSIEEQIVPEEEEEDQRVPSQSKDKRPSRNTTLENSPETSPTESGARPKTVQRSINFSTETQSPPQPISMEAQNGGLDRSNTFPSFSGYSPFPGIHPPGLHSSLHHSGLNDNVFQSPYLRNSLLSPSLLTRNISTPLLNASYPTQSHDQEPVVSRSHSFHNLSSPPTSLTAAGALSRETTLPRVATLNTSTVGGTGLQSGLDLGARATGPYLSSHHSPGYTSILPDPYMPSATARIPMSSNLPLDQQNRQIAILINELDAQREEVKKMKKMLADRDLETETLKLTLRTKDLEEGKSTEVDKAAGIVEEVYAAQKMRDEAATKRMEIIKDERDDIAARLHEVEARLDAQYSNQSLDGFQLNDEQFNLEDINLPMSPSSVDHQHSSMINRVETIQERQREVMRGEMQIVTDQRDMALARCHKLELELQKYQRERDADGGMDKNLRAKLAAVRQERDMAVAKSKQLDDEIQTLRIHHSLYKSLIGENTVQQPANNTTAPSSARALFTNELNTNQQELAQTHQEINHLKEQIEIGKRQHHQECEAIMKEKERLERLSNVLIRKLEELKKEKHEEEKK